MAIIAKDNGGGQEFEPIPAGSYFGRCYSMIHIGTREESIGGKPPVKMNKVYIRFEIPSETVEIDGKPQPRIIGKELNLSMNKKATLRGFLDSWRGKAFSDKEAAEFDVTKLLGVAAMITLVHKTAASGNVYVNITGVAKPPKGTEIADQITPNFEFNYDLFAKDQTILDQVPEFIQNKIKESEEYAAVTGGAAPEAGTPEAEPQTEDADAPLF